MKKKSRSQLLLVGVVATLTFLMGVVLNVTPARAEAIRVSGADHLYSDGAEESSVDILTVTGQKGDTVYINMQKGQEVLASHLAFTLDGENAEADANGDMVGVVSVSFAADKFSHEDAYTVDVFSDRQETEANRLYGGTVSTIFAQYEDANKMEPLVVRTLTPNESRPFSAPETRVFNGVTYKLKTSDPQVIDGKVCYVYAPSADVAESVEAHVTYYDQSNPSAPIKTDTITLSKGQSQQAEIPSVVSDASGALYRTLQLAGSVTLAHPGVSEQSIMCKKLNADWGKVDSFYTAKISYVDEAGNSLGMVDSVIVNKQYRYTPPARLYINTNGTVGEYELVQGQELLTDKNVLELQPGAEQGVKQYKIAYAPVKDDAERVWTVVLENGSVAPNDPNRVIERKTYRGTPGQTATHETQKKIVVDGKDYVPTASAQDSYTHEFTIADMGVEQVIYYVPDGYVAPEPYQVNVKYVNIADNRVIDTKSVTASPDMREDLEITSPESFSKDGVEWIRLNGQEGAIRHSFYSPAREYVVYYRDINDDLHAQTVIRNVRVVYVDEEGNTVTRPTTVVDNGQTETSTTTAQNGGTTEQGTDAGQTGAANGAEGTQANPVEGGTANAAGGVDTGLPTGASLVAIDGVDGADGAELVGQDGTDMATTRIEDDTTPLAGPNSGKGSSQQMTGVAIAVGGIAAAAAIGLLLFFFKRRKQGTNESSEDDLTA